MSIIKSNSSDDKITHKGLNMGKKKNKNYTSIITKRYYNLNPSNEEEIIVKCKKKNKYKIIG